MPLPGTSHEHLFETFSAMLEAAGGHATVVSSIREVAGIVRETPGLAPGSDVWRADEASDAFPALDDVLREADVTPRSPEDPAAVRDAPLGVTVARLAIAETGSVLLHENHLPGRAVSLMTQQLIVLCPMVALVTSLDDAAPVLREISREGSSYATFVTGPSRTADIERELAVGVQGPGVLQVVFVAEVAS